MYVLKFLWFYLYINVKVLGIVYNEGLFVVGYDGDILVVCGSFL